MAKAPERTTINSSEYVPDAGTLPFAPELIPIILSGEKLSTYRLGRKYDGFEPGDIAKIQDSASKQLVGNVKILSKKYLRFDELPVNDGLHESYRDKNHQRQVFAGYYAYIGRPIADDDEFLILDFQLL